MTADNGAMEADRLVGKRIRMRRHMLGLSQTELGEAIGVKFQQVQKYETGTNRVSASRIVEVARAMGCSVQWFFQDIEGATEDHDALRAQNRQESNLLLAVRAMRPETREAVSKVTEVVRTIAEGAT